VVTGMLDGRRRVDVGLGLPRGRCDGFGDVGDFKAGEGDGRVDIGERERARSRQASAKASGVTATRRGSG